MDKIKKTYYRKADFNKVRKVIGLYSGEGEPRCSLRNGAVQFTDLRLAYSLYRERSKIPKNLNESTLKKKCTKI